MQLANHNSDDDELKKVRRDEQTKLPKIEHLQANKESTWPTTALLFARREIH
jgi:hypothetical protein